MLMEVLHAASVNHPGGTPKTIMTKIVFLSKVIRNKKLLCIFKNRIANLEHNCDIALSPNMLGLLEWPYINDTWKVEKRLDVVATHYELLETTCSSLKDVDKDSPLLIADLSFVSEGVRVLIDRAPWFIREGELVLNLFDDELRVASIAFTLGNDSSGLMIIVGAIQGIHSGIPREQSLLIFKKLTKLFQGLRPRSLLIDILRMIAITIDAERIVAVADEHRHHRHPYFGKRHKSKFCTDYNKIWVEHGGRQTGLSGFYEIPIVPTRKALSEVPSKKRAMYRRRQQIIDTIERLVVKSCNLF